MQACTVGYNDTLLIYRCGGSVGLSPTSRLTSRVDWTQKRGVIIGGQLNKATANALVCLNKQVLFYNSSDAVQWSPKLAL